MTARAIAAAGAIGGASLGRVPVMEDFDLTLQLLKLGKPNRVSKNAKGFLQLRATIPRTFSDYFDRDDRLRNFGFCDAKLFMSASFGASLARHTKRNRYRLLLRLASMPLNSNIVTDALA